MSPFWDDCEADCCDMTQKMVDSGMPTESIVDEQTALIVSKLDSITQIVSNWNIPPKDLEAFRYWCILQPYLNIIALRYGINLGTVTPGPAQVSLQQTVTTGTTTDSDVVIFDADVSGIGVGGIQNTGGVNAVRFDVTLTDFRGVTSSTFNTVPFGTGTTIFDASNLPGGLNKPLKHVKITVRDVVLGAFTTYAITITAKQ